MCKANKASIDPLTIGISELEELTGLSRNICYRLGEQAGAVVVIPGIDRKLFSYPIIKEYLEKHLLINQEKGAAEDGEN